MGFSQIEFVFLFLALINRSPLTQQKVPPNIVDKSLPCCRHPLKCSRFIGLLEINRSQCLKFLKYFIVDSSMNTTRSQQSQISHKIKNSFQSLRNIKTGGPLKTSNITKMIRNAYLVNSTIQLTNLFLRSRKQHVKNQLYQSSL
ncbi:Hypothetical_protein [Hexamita inflata]|uniref:Hypothetical_protein n=1 Tax=Hexamita inflata TaxID=28002 RepID=A0AA86UIV6_9EUKA|nr:Hypothetical protein HINF_LOCUS40502 [Hexamita inflata]